MPRPSVGDGGAIGGLIEGACDLTVCGAIQLLTNFGATVDGLGQVLSYDADSIIHGRALDDLGAGWNAMLGMSDHDKARFWTDVVGGGFFLGKGITGAASAVRGAAGAKGALAATQGVAETACDLTCFGNSTGPKIRPIDYLMSGDDITPNTPRGLSTWEDHVPDGFSGIEWRLPAGTKLPNGISLVRDLKPAGHWTFTPSFPMTLDGWGELIRSLGWVRGARR